jgi:hypothetical protein
MKTYPRTSSLLCDYIAEEWKPNAQGCLMSNVQYNPNSQFVTSEEYKYIQSWIEKIGTKTYYDNMLKEDYTTLCFPSFKNGDSVHKVVASMPRNSQMEEQLMLKVRSANSHAQSLPAIHSLVTLIILY